MHGEVSIQLQNSWYLGLLYSYSMEEEKKFHHPSGITVVYALYSVFIINPSANNTKLLAISFFSFKF